MKCEDCGHTPNTQDCITVQHERWAADRWKVMFRVNGMAFHIGAECDTREAADRLKSDFAAALTALGVEMPNAELSGGEAVRSDDLLAFYEDVAPFLRRLREPRFDHYETNNYVCGSTDCKNALAALDAVEANDERTRAPNPPEK